MASASFESDVLQHFLLSDFTYSKTDGAQLLLEAAATIVCINSLERICQSRLLYFLG